MLWRILAAILHLGNVSIVSANKKNEECGIHVEFQTIFLYFLDLFLFYSRK